MSQPIQNTKKIIEKTTEIMFETFQITHFYLAKSPALIIYSTGRNTGFVVESGGDKTDLCGIYEGFCFHNSAVSIPFGGNQLTNYFQKLLEQNESKKKNFFKLRNSVGQDVQFLKIYLSQNSRNLYILPNTN